MKKGDSTEEPQQDAVNLKSIMELIKTQQNTLSDLKWKLQINKKTLTKKLKKLTYKSKRFKLEKRKFRSLSKK